MNPQKMDLSFCRVVVQRSPRGVRWNQKMPYETPSWWHDFEMFGKSNRTYGDPVREPAIGVLSEQYWIYPDGRGMDYLANNELITPKRGLKNGMLSGENGK